MISHYVDRDGQPIGVMEWGRLFEDQAGRTLAEDAVTRGRVLRTCWTGFVCPAANIRPFGSALRLADDRVFEVAQYDTKEEAMDGHRRLVEVLNGRA